MNRTRDKRAATEQVGAADRSGTAWRAVQATFLVLAGAFFLFSMRASLSPFLLYCVFIALLAPFRGFQGYALLVTVATVLMSLWVLSTAGSLLAPFFLAFVLAYILDPLADRLSAHPRIGRTTAILLLLAPFLALAAVSVVFGVPELVRQARDLIRQAPEFIEGLTAWVRGLTPTSLGFDIPFVDEPALLAWIQELDAQSVTDYLESRREELTQHVWAALLGLGRGFGTLLTVLGYLLLTPVLTFYLLRDYDRIVARVGGLLPRKLKPGVSGFASEYDDLLSRYLRGQVSVSLITGGITWLGLLSVGFPYAFLLGVIVAVLGVIPYMGVVVSLIPATIIALVSENTGLSLIKVAAVYGVAQGLESAVISPRIVGKSVALHPVWIVLALSLGGFYFGFVGLLAGVPLAVAAKLLLVRGLQRWTDSADPDV